MLHATDTVTQCCVVSFSDLAVFAGVTDLSHVACCMLQTSSHSAVLCHLVDLIVFAVVTDMSHVACCMLLTASHSAVFCRLLLPLAGVVLVDHCH